MNNKPTWQQAEQLRDDPRIGEVITNFAHDQTGDNATGIVLAVLEYVHAEAAKATGTAGELPPLPSHPEAQVMRWSELEQKAIREYGQQCAEAARHDADAAKRLRLICKMVGIESHVPADDETLWGAAFAVLGQIRAALEAARQPAPSRDEIEGAFAIKVEKMLCEALGRQWSAVGISVEGLISELKSQQPAPVVVVSDRDMMIAQAVRQACVNSYSPDDSASDYTEKMGDIDLATVIRAATNRSQP